jgi:L-alanine-DL-glutamate epimerase-like enolase superfamily enzyme
VSASSADIPIGSVRAAAFTVPTDAPEADGTLDWSSTTIVVVHANGGGCTGVGYSYTHASAATLVADLLAPIVLGGDVMNVESAYDAMGQRVRNIGRQGLAATAISAVDVALWDLKAHVLGTSLVALLGSARDRIRVYGSGGFTSYGDPRLMEQLGGWFERGIDAVKMKVGRDAVGDRRRVHLVRDTIGSNSELFVDANGAYSRKLALAQADAFARDDVVWFEEPVSSDDLDGLRLIRDLAPAGMDIAAGEYGYDPQYFKRMLDAGAVDVLQADATRCGGVSGFLRAAALCDAAGLPLSSHTAPSVHAHLGCAAARTRHLEYFYDHVRIERMLFDGVLEPVGGALRPDRSRPGLGITLKQCDAERFAV